MIPTLLITFQGIFKLDKEFSGIKGGVYKKGKNVSQMKGIINKKEV
jgi:hypothetical protein